VRTARTASAPACCRASPLASYYTRLHAHHATPRLAARTRFCTLRGLFASGTHCTTPRVCYAFSRPRTVLCHTLHLHAPLDFYYATTSADLPPGFIFAVLDAFAPHARWFGLPLAPFLHSLWTITIRLQLRTCRAASRLTMRLPTSRSPRTHSRCSPRLVLRLHAFRLFTPLYCRQPFCIVLPAPHCSFISRMRVAARTGRAHAHFRCCCTTRLLNSVWTALSLDSPWFHT